MAIPDICARGGCIIHPLDTQQHGCLKRCALWIPDDTDKEKKSQERSSKSYTKRYK